MPPLGLASFGMSFEWHDRKIVGSGRSFRNPAREMTNFEPNLN